MATTGPQRVPLASVRPGSVANSSNTIYARASTVRSQRAHVPARVAHRVPVPVPEEYLEPAEEESEDDDEMEVEENVPPARTLTVEEASLLVAEDEVESMIPPRTEEIDSDEGELELAVKAERIWPEVNTERAHRYRHQIDEIKEVFEDPVDEFDMTMVSEYHEEIFEYMNELEVCSPKRYPVGYICSSCS